MIYRDDDDPYAGIYPYDEPPQTQQGMADFYKRPDDKPQWQWDEIYGPGAPPTSGGGNGRDGYDLDLTAEHIIRGPLLPATGTVSGGGDGFGGGGGDYDYGGGGGGGYGGGFNWSAPSLNYPDWVSAGPFVAPDRTPLKAFAPRTATFDLDPYQASSWADAENEPGYAAARKQLKDQVQASAAHRGMVRSGMTLGDIYTNLDALSQQNFRQFDDRRFRNWQGNQDQRLTKFQQEYGIDRDVYDRYAADIESGNAYRYGAAKDAYGFHAADVDRGNNYRFNVADAQFKDALARWQSQVASLTSLGRPVD